MSELKTQIEASHGDMTSNLGDILLTLDITFVSEVDQHKAQAFVDRFAESVRVETWPERDVTDEWHAVASGVESTYATVWINGPSSPSPGWFMVSFDPVLAGGRLLPASALELPDGRQGIRLRSDSAPTISTLLLCGLDTQVSSVTILLSEPILSPTDASPSPIEMVQDGVTCGVSGSDVQFEVQRLDMFCDGLDLTQPMELRLTGEVLSSQGTALHLSPSGASTFAIAGKSIESFTSADPCVVLRVP